MTGTTDVGSGGTPPNITVTDNAVMKRAVGAAAVGNITEWFDFGVYAYLATTIEENFFPPDNPTLAQVGTFAGFAVSFLVRPLGGLFFGPLGDRIGRTQVLVDHRHHDGGRDVPARLHPVVLRRSASGPRSCSCSAA